MGFPLLLATPAVLLLRWDESPMEISESRRIQAGGEDAIGGLLVVAIGTFTWLLVCGGGGWRRVAFGEEGSLDGAERIGGKSYLPPISGLDAPRGLSLRMQTRISGPGP
jgi:hypothetical protein